MKNYRQFIKKHGGGKERKIKLVKEGKAPLLSFPTIRVDFLLNPENNTLYFISQILNPTNDFLIICGEEHYLVSKLVVFNTIPEIKIAIEKDYLLKSYEINEGINFSQVAKIFQSEEVLVTTDNVDDILNVADQLKIEQLVSKLKAFISTTKKQIESLEPFSDDIWQYNTLYSMFLDLTEANFERTLSEFSNSIYIQQDMINIVLNVIDKVSIIRPYSNEILVKLCIRISPLFGNSLFCDYSMKTKNFFFLHELFTNGLIDKEKLLKIIDSDTPELFCWFSPDLEEWNSRIYYELLQEYQLSFNEYSKSEKYIKDEKNIALNKKVLILNIMKFYENNWELHRKMTRNGNNPNELAQKIREDDVEGFQDVLKSDSMDQLIPNSIFERCSLLTCNPRLIEYAAFFGSVKCFKFFLLNHEKIYNSLYFAIAGGSTEIIRLCYHENAMMSSGFVPAITYLRNNVFEWLFSVSNSVPNELISTCYSHDNLGALQTLIEKGFNMKNNLINYCPECKNILLAKIYFALGCTPDDDNCIILSIIHGNAEVLRYIFYHIGRNRDIKINNDYMPFLASNPNLKVLEVLMEYEKIQNIDKLLTVGCKTGSLEMVNYILSQNLNINVNMASEDGLTPLMIAASNGFFDIVQRLLEIPEIDLDVKIDSINAAKIAANNGHFKINSFIMNEIRKRRRIKTQA